MCGIFGKPPIQIKNTFFKIISGGKDKRHSFTSETVYALYLFISTRTDVHQVIIKLIFDVLTALTSEQTSRNVAHET